MATDTCGICSTKEDVLRTFSGDGICASCLKKKGSILLTYRMYFPEHKKPLAERKVVIVAHGDTYPKKDMLSSLGFQYTEGMWKAQTTPQGAIKGHIKLAEKIGAIDGYTQDQDEDFSDTTVLPPNATNGLVEIFGNAFKRY